MTKRRLRLILLGLLFITLFLPVDPDPQVPFNWLFSIWYFMEFLAAIPNTTFKPDIGDWIREVGHLLYLFAIQILILLNLSFCLSVRPARKLERLYRISLLVLLPLVWWQGIFIIDPYRGIGYWANPVMVTVAALMEIGLVIHERSRKSVNLNP
jgi:hypothetical protein